MHGRIDQPARQSFPHRGENAFARGEVAVIAQNQGHGRQMGAGPDAHTVSGFREAEERRVGAIAVGIGLVGQEELAARGGEVNQAFLERHTGPGVV